MLAKGPHISTDIASLVPRTLHIEKQEFDSWPEAVKRLTLEIAAELFLVRYNPFVAPDLVKKSVADRFAAAKQGLAHHYVTTLHEGIAMFWSAHEQDRLFRQEVIARLQKVMLPQNIDTSNYALVETATDATDLRLELPLLVVAPSSLEEISAIMKLANEMQFAVVPRGGGSGATGGAVPARKRCVVLSLSKLNAISNIDPHAKTLTAQAGVITNDAIIAAAQHKLLFSIDPASKISSSIGGNIAENAGGPLCFEYGTTIDNILSYRMVTPTGECIEIVREQHPRHAIRPDETATFKVQDLSGGLRNLISLPASTIRTPGLGKDVTNKALGGLPGLQKEGTDGIIVDATFMLHDTLAHNKVMVLEFFGRSMENSMLVINDIVALRDDIRRRGDLVKLTALEEFNIKYVQAIEYRKKSHTYEGDPISVLIIQIDSNDVDALEETAEAIVQICNSYDSVDVFVAKDAKEAELFWEDRHKLSMIARHTSGFKINEDVVIPMQAIPDFAHFLEGLNLEYTARAYRSALKKIGNLPGLPEEDASITEEIAYATRIVQGEIPVIDLSDEELHLHAVLFLRSLIKSYPQLTATVSAIEKEMTATRISVASHMHAGDGNWHVNIPVNSNNQSMMANAEKVAHIVMAKAQELGGEVTGEHGIGITKIAFLTEEKMRDFTQYKERVDPRNICNPAKLTQRDVPVAPFTFSFNRLIQDLQQSGLAGKEDLISLLSNIQVCTRCGKCKQHCPMHSPEAGMLYHPRNKNLVLGALIEAIYYAQVNTGKIDPALFRQLDAMMEHCTGCGKCMTVCPVKIASQEVALALRGYIEDAGAGSHPIKSYALQVLAQQPASRIPKAAKLAAFGQRVQNNLVPLVPKSVRRHIDNPLFSGKGPVPEYGNLHETLHLEKNSIFLPTGECKGTVLFFPGCGASVFFRHTGVAAIGLLLEAGYAVVLPEQHLCCGYPLLASGAHDAFAQNQDNNIRHLRMLAHKAAEAQLPITHVLTACGSCSDGMQRHFIPEVFSTVAEQPVLLDDIGLFLCAHQPAPDTAHLPRLEGAGMPKHLIFQSACHSAVAHMHRVKAAPTYAKTLQDYIKIPVSLSPGCCGESGMGAMTSPAIYNKIRAKKSAQLSQDIAKHEEAAIVVSCPSCKMGIQRSLLATQQNTRVLHVAELFAERLYGKTWRRQLKKLLRAASVKQGVRHVDMRLAHTAEGEA